MDLKNKYKKLHGIIKVLLCAFCFISSGAYSDPVWDIIDGSRDENFLNSIDIPDNAFLLSQ